VATASVFFTLRTGVSDEQQHEAIRNAGQVPGVAAVAPLDAASPAEAVRQMYFASLRAGADAEAVRQALQAVPHVESASLSARRKLL
jgi:hypothetical protein